MARAGFDPRQSVELWKNMMAYSQGKAPPEFLTDHPSDQKRIEALQEHLPAAIQTYDQARASGRHPSCGTPPA
jgi:predicted Zn-dependent protease